MPALDPVDAVSDVLMLNGSSVVPWLVFWTAVPVAWVQLPPATEFPTDSPVLGDCLIENCCQQY